MLNAVGRGLALFFGLFCLTNLLGDIWRPGFDANIWWIDIRALPHELGNSLLGLSAIVLLAYALRPHVSKWRRCVTVTVLLLLLLCATFNVFVFYALLMGGQIVSFPLPLSLLVIAGLSWILLNLFKQREIALNIRQRLVMWLTPGACCVVLAVGTMVLYGYTDYRRPADAIVVLGARVYANGQPSDALADRVRTACELYGQGYADWLVVSGGPGDGDIHETDAMRQMALDLGVPSHAIIIDDHGLNTRLTVVNTNRLFAEHNIDRVLVVSHFYHLPRIKMAYQRIGRQVYTVPARESYTLTKMPIFIAREVAAFWVYYADPPA